MSMILSDFLDTLKDNDIIVRKNGLEALNTIAHNIPQILKDDIEVLLESLYEETKVKPELIKEVDLGPFKHKVDDGMPLRKASFTVLETLVDKIPEKMNVPQLIDVVIKGLDDPIDECISKS